jgi:putative acetyltransferase
MQTNNFKINPYTDIYRQQVLTIWEKSVLSTHDFLTTTDFEEIKGLSAT